jgi:predicted ATPase with chaperone activity
MAILCLGHSSLRIDGYGFIGELAPRGSVRLVTGVLPMARCLRAAGFVSAPTLPSPVCVAPPPSPRPPERPTDTV